MRLIDADAFDRRLANAEFAAALNNADDNDRPFEHEAMYYSTQSFRDVMSHQPTIDAIPMEWLEEQRDKLSEAWDEEWYEINGLIEQWREEQEAR